MNIVFTICSNNYLAHAATLMESWFEHHPDSLAYLILVDELNDKVDYEILKSVKLIQVQELNIPDFKRLIEEYNITELNTAVKPDAYQYLFKNNPDSKIVYLDPDILVTGELKEVFDALEVNDFVLTPHICSPIDDDKAPTDYHTLRTGIFNLGFLALKKSKQTDDFLNWWRDRVYKYGYANFSANMFYDQLWTNYIPVFYDRFYILKHLGYNVANWNLHERVISYDEINEKWLVNNRFDLKFFHFSSYTFLRPDIICTYNTRFDFNSRPDLLHIFKQYQVKLIEFGVNRLKDVPCIYFEKHKQLKVIKESNRIKELIRAHKALPLKTKIIKKIAHIATRLAEQYNK